MEHPARNQQESFFGQLTPKAAFLFGAASGIAVSALLGLLLIVPNAVSFEKGTTANTNTPDSGSNAALAGDPVGDFRPVDAQRDHIRGANNAAVTIIEYSDLECPFCKRHHPTMQQLLAEYKGKVRWVYRHFPLESLHAQAKREAIASECANEQGKFWEFVDAILAATPSNDGLDLTKLPDYAANAGVADIAAFNACVASEKYADVVENDVADAASAGAQGTPHSIIIDANGGAVALSGALPYAQFKQAVDNALQAS